jgi:hypothetical protein
MRFIAAPIAAILAVLNFVCSDPSHFPVRNRESAAYMREKIVALFSTLMSFFS